MAATFSKPSTDWREIIAPDEGERFAAYAREVTGIQQAYASSRRGPVLRGGHAKLHAGVRATFRVLDGLPDFARHGVFSESKSYAAWVRFSGGHFFLQHDFLPDPRGMAIKVLDVDGPLLRDDSAESPPTQDFLAANQCFRSLRNERHLMLLTRSATNPITSPFKLVYGLGPVDMLRFLRDGLRMTFRPIGSLATESFWSNVPIQCGPHAIKFKLNPAQLGSRGRKWWRGDSLREELIRRLRTDDVRFDFLAQFYIDERTTPLEDFSLGWNPQDTPFIKLAEVIIPRCDLMAANAKADEQLVDNLAFNPWHCLEDHRPLGGVQRSRRVVYEASARLRSAGQDVSPCGSREVSQEASP